MAESLREKIERFIGDFDEPYNFRNVLFTTLQKSFVTHGSPHRLPDVEPSPMYEAITAFVASTVERLGLGLIIRVVQVRDRLHWRELYRITVFHDEVADTYAIQLFEHEELVRIARISRDAVDWGCPPEEGSPQEVAFHGFITGLCRGVPLRPQPEPEGLPVLLPADDGDISIEF